MPKWLQWILVLSGLAFAITLIAVQLVPSKEVREMEENFDALDEAIEELERVREQNN